MPTLDPRADAEPFKPNGNPMPYSDLLDLATVTPQDISAALDLATEAFPSRFEKLLD